MKTLLLVRHAKTESPFSWKQDYDRCLTNTGIQDAIRMGQWLRSQPFQIERVLASPAERTRHTTQLICHELEIRKEWVEFREELYHAAPETFRQVIAAISDNVETAMIVSHNDGITQFANQLTHTKIDHMQPGSIFSVKIHAETWGNLFSTDNTFLFYKEPGR